MDVALAKMSSKGQIVIPSNLRHNLDNGEEFLIIKEKDTIIIKKVKSLTNKFREDLDFAKKIDAAWESYDKGEFKTTKADKFLKELEKC